MNPPHLRTNEPPNFEPWARTRGHRQNIHTYTPVNPPPPPPPGSPLCTTLHLFFLVLIFYLGGTQVWVRAWQAWFCCLVFFFCVSVCVCECMYPTGLDGPNPLFCVCVCVCAF